MLTFSLSSACDAALSCQILCKSVNSRRSYYIILLLQDGGHCVANLVPITGLATSDILASAKAIGAPNFNQRYQSMAEILLTLVSENKRPPYWNSTSGWTFHCHWHVICTGLSNFKQVGWSSTSYDVILVLQDGGHGVANLPISGLAMSHTLECL